MPHKLRKTRKLRGSRTHGYGRVTQHRKSGSRGGKGKAGGHKHKWLHTVKYEPNRFRKIGFTSIHSLGPPQNTINTGALKDLVTRIHGAEGIGSDQLEINLTDLGFDKLLGKGEVGVPLRVRISSCTSKALEKVKAAGGDVVKPE